MAKTFERTTRSPAHVFTGTSGLDPEFERAHHFFGPAVGAEGKAGAHSPCLIDKTFVRDLVQGIDFHRDAVFHRGGNNCVHPGVGPQFVVPITAAFGQEARAGKDGGFILQ